LDGIGSGFSVPSKSTKIVAIRLTLFYHVHAQQHDTACTAINKKKKRPGGLSANQGAILL